MKVFIADKVSPQMVKDIERTGAQVTYAPDVSEAELAGSIGDSHALIVRSKKVNAAAISIGARLNQRIALATADAAELERALGFQTGECCRR